MAPNKSLENVCSSVLFFKAIPATPLQVKKKYFLCRSHQLGSVYGLVTQVENEIYSK